MGEVVVSGCESAKLRERSTHPLDRAAEGIAVIRLFSAEEPCGGTQIEQGIDIPAIGHWAAARHECGWSAEAISQNNDFRGSPTANPRDRLGRRSPFAGRAAVMGLQRGEVGQHLRRRTGHQCAQHIRRGSIHLATSGLQHIDDVADGTANIRPLVCHADRFEGVARASPPDRR